MPRISLKTPAQIEIMAEGGKILGSVMNQVLAQVVPGLSTLEINNWIEKRIVDAGAECSFKLVPRYHWASCVGLNDEVVHSIPRSDKIIKEGDVLKIDAGIYWKGYHTDASWTIRVRKTEDGGQKTEDEELKDKFLSVGERALKKAIEAARPGKRIGDISLQIQQTLEGAGYTPVTLLTGHGIGKELHEDPMIPCFLKSKVSRTLKIEVGMSLAIEVIYNLGKPDLVMEEDDWTISTKDGKISGLFEETVAVCEKGPRILTEIGGLFVC